MRLFHLAPLRTSQIIIFLVLIVFAIKGVWAQQDETLIRVKSAYVYNFIQYVTWPDESKLKTLRIGYYGNDNEYFSSLTQMETRRVRGLSLEVVRVSNIKDSTQVQILVVGQNHSHTLSNIANELSRQPILIVSESATDKKNTMLNFVLTETNTVSFELNRYNMINAELKVSPNILVLGGTELDIANVLRELDDNLSNSLEQLRTQSEKLDELQQQIVQRELLLSKQESTLSQQSRQLQSQSNTLQSNIEELQNLRNNFAVLTEQLKSTNSELELNRNKLSDQNTEIEEQRQTITGFEQQITERKDALAYLEEQKHQLENEISIQETQITQQKKEMQNQSSVIRTQSSLIVLSVVGIFSILVLLTIIYRSNKSKQKANNKLKQNIQVLANLNHQLRETQSQLVESEKMAALGGLVAGVAHEINTPIGVGLTAATHLSDNIDEFHKEYESGKLLKESLDNFLIDAKDASGLLSRNLHRASDLIRNFKQIAVDQSSEERREFELKAYLEDLVQSLTPQLKLGGHHVTIVSEQDIELDCYPGIIAQVMTNLIMNSSVHGFKNKTNGNIEIRLETDTSDVHIDYKDNGVGLDAQQIEQVFDPFFTTERGSGGSGLGMSISYNLVVRKLEGSIKCLPSDTGAHFHITFPL